MHLAVLSDGCLDETDIDKSRLGRLGTGRILDQLASLIDRGLLKASESGGFCVTDQARKTLWSDDVPLWVRILRVLDTKSLVIGDICTYLNEPGAAVTPEAEMLRRNGLVMITTIRDDSGIQKLFEILPDGRDALREGGAHGRMPGRDHGDALHLLAQLEEQIGGLDADSKVRQDMISKLEQIRQKIGR